MRQVKLQLTQDHISRATGGTMNCPIACMLRLNGFPTASVGYRWWREYFLGDKIPLTPSMKLIIRKFDNGKPIRPCIILVNMP